MEEYYKNNEKNSVSEYADLVVRMRNGEGNWSDTGRFESLNETEKLELGLEASEAKEILSGELPKKQAKELADAGADGYFICSNQSGVQTPKEIRDYLNIHNGVATNVSVGHEASGLSDRFYSYGAITTHRDGAVDIEGRDCINNRILLSTGYERDMNSCRFIIAVPIKFKTKENYDWLCLMEGTPVGDLKSTMFERGMLPKDFYVEDKQEYYGEKKVSVNERYVSGIIDGYGVYSENAGFLR
ncbi:MAG: hypothetical protein LBM09_01700 [Candidatus Nomurabacteria bacterium]|jgi:hypothetical protein|nr:hypothetical protein [Candidatus Nomurabacteria bacterium]